MKFHLGEVNFLSLPRNYLYFKAEDKNNSEVQCIETRKVIFNSVGSAVLTRLMLPMVRALHFAQQKQSPLRLQS